MAAGSSYSNQPAGTATVYRYYNPQTNQHVTSLLPPDHPEMICLQAGHIAQTRYGLVGEIDEFRSSSSLSEHVF